MRQPGGVVQFAAGLVELAERDSDPGQERGAEPVQRHPPAAPVEQRDAEFGLQAGDRPAERGLRHAEFLGRAAHVLVAGDGLEVAQLQEVHGAPAFSFL